MKHYDDRGHLVEFLEAAKKAVGFVQGMSRPDAERNDVLIFALIRLFEVMGSAVNAISPSFQQSHPTFPWQDIIGAHHRFPRERLDVDFATLWTLSTFSLPNWMGEMEKIIPEASIDTTVEPSGQPRINIDQGQIATFCGQNHIRKFSLFGSVLRGDFGRDSDIDVLIEFEPGHELGLAFFGLEIELSNLLGHKVDLNTPEDLSLRFRNIVREQAYTLYPVS